MPGFRARQCESCILFYLFWLSKIIFSESYLEICVGRERENYIFKREHMLLQSKNKQAKKHRCRQNMCSRENIFLKNEPHIFYLFGGVHSRRCSGTLFLNVYSRVYIHWQYSGDICGAMD